MADESIIKFEMEANAKKALASIEEVKKGIGSLNATNIGASLGSALGGEKGGIIGGAIFGGAYNLANAAINAIPGANQVGGLLRDSFMANTQAVYARADAIGNAYDRARNAIGLAGSDIDAGQARDIFQQFKDMEFRRVDSDAALREKLGPEVFDELKKNASRAPEAILEDMWKVLESIWAWMQTLPVVKWITG